MLVFILCGRGSSLSWLVLISQLAQAAPHLEQVGQPSYKSFLSFLLNLSTAWTLSSHRHWQHLLNSYSDVCPSVSELQRQTASVFTFTFTLKKSVYCDLKFTNNSLSLIMIDSCERQICCRNRSSCRDSFSSGQQKQAVMAWKEDVTSFLLQTVNPIKTFQQ